MRMKTGAHPESQETRDGEEHAQAHEGRIAGEHPSAAATRAQNYGHTQIVNLYAVGKGHGAAPRRMIETADE